MVLAEFYFSDYRQEGGTIGHQGAGSDPILENVLLNSSGKDSLP